MSSLYFAVEHHLSCRSFCLAFAGLVFPLGPFPLPFPVPLDPVVSRSPLSFFLDFLLQRIAGASTLYFFPFARFIVWLSVFNPLSSLVSHLPSLSPFLQLSCFEGVRLSLFFNPLSSVLFFPPEGYSQSRKYILSRRFSSSSLVLVGDSISMFFSLSFTSLTLPIHRIYQFWRSKTTKKKEKKKRRTPLCPWPCYLPIY